MYYQGRMVRGEVLFYFHIGNSMELETKKDLSDFGFRACCIPLCRLHILGYHSDILLVV